LPIALNGKTSHMTERHWIRNSTALAVLLKYFARAHIWVYQRTNGRLGARLL
jgi:F420H(2)-dependent quinone reductase